ncbi:type III secretion pilus protein SctF [Mycetohabitans sp. B5]|uniref:Uncharacterized protein n=1 Tax=Mycetohabitans endofungorum TaxID=417203 RepID=A0A2P5KAI3_9BURK|nr:MULTISPECIES: type III secretion pilus protein SctF [Mycetohabitans]MCG1054976.1 type III secretion pilus protein SctF [Mycetohabitans sp. B5]PPB83713.1 hypothetical protein B0O95_106104 [Mycetohabitans endofungorum]
MSITSGINHGTNIAGTAESLAHFGTSAAAGKTTQTAANAEMREYANMITESQLNSMACQFQENLSQAVKEVGAKQI